MAYILDHLRTDFARIFDIGIVKGVSPVVRARGMGRQPHGLCGANDLMTPQQLKGEL